MFGNHVASWNVLDTHMMETLEALMEWARGRGAAARASHDVRASLSEH